MYHTREVSMSAFNTQDPSNNQQDNSNRHSPRSTDKSSLVLKTANLLYQQSEVHPLPWQPRFTIAIQPSTDNNKAPVKS
jgi:hypothetical protein